MKKAAHTINHVIKVLTTETATYDLLDYRPDRRRTSYLFENVGFKLQNVFVYLKLIVASYNSNYLIGSQAQRDAT